ncbi:MAG TPA: pyrroline-5-carboxylate reductase [Thermoanaerobaculia bacterium]|nr:pyrroline-5-carboxylate reductase [Thermoanaerobaculia bacterium]
MTERSAPLERRIAVLGAGKMGETLIRALVESQAVRAADVVATAAHPETLERLTERLGVAVTLDNREAVEGAGLVLLAVKPQVAASVLAEIGDRLAGDQILVSILAGVPLAALEARIAAAVPVVRAMPNTPTLVGAGMTALAGGRHAGPEHVAAAEAVFRRVGRTLVLDEKHFDAVTGLSASGPAFLYIVIESLAEGGVKAGLPRHVAIELAAQTCLGAGRMVVETGSHPALLKDAVTTPAGCTVDGILALEEGGLRVTLIKAVVEAARRAGELLDPGSSR